MRPHGTPCQHEHSCLRCPMLAINPKMFPRLDEIEADLVVRRARAEHEAWLGEVEGIDRTLTYLRQKTGGDQAAGAHRPGRTGHANTPVTPSLRWRRIPGATMSLMATQPDRPTPDAPLYQAMIAGGVDYRPWAGQGLADDECFLCATALTGGTHTVEDVFPRWMQRKIAQRKHKGVSIELPNLTHIRPERIKVPACKTCNGVHLSQIEKIIAQAFNDGMTRSPPCPNGRCAPGSPK